MEYSKNGLALTEQFEGCEHLAYKDVGGVWTIGYGHTGPDVQPGLTCSHEQAEAWLLADVEKAANAVNTMVRVPLTQGEFDALCDFVFNAGAAAFHGSRMLALLNQGDYTAAAEQFERWCHCDGKVVAGLLRRRQAEKAMWGA
jgi:lysozyme